MPENSPQKKTDDSGKNLSPVTEIAEFVRRLCISQSNAVMYAADHPMAVKSMRDAFEWLEKMLARKKEPVIVSATEGHILFEGLPVEENNPLVNRLAKSFEQLHINNLFFEPGVDFEEFKKLHIIMARGPAYVNEHGGLVDLLKKEGITHITSHEASYVLVTEGEKVIARDAKVVTKGKSGEGDADQEIVNYMVAQVLKQAEQKKWLLNEIKNRPQKMAARIIDGIELATSRSELGREESGDTIETLLQNIKMIGQSIAAQTATPEDADSTDLEDAVLTLEKELRSRSHQLMSSKVAAGFINEILAIIASVSDQVRARRISDQFLKGEKGLKEVEKLLQSFSSERDQSEEFLRRIRDAARQRGISESDLEKIMDHVTHRKKKPARRRTPRRRKPFDEALLDGLRTQVRKLGLAPDRVDAAVDSLAVFVNRKINAREKTAQTARANLEAALDKSNIAGIIWDDEGRVIYVHPRALKKTGLKTGTVLSPALLEYLAGLDPAAGDKLPDGRGAAIPDRTARSLLASATSILRDRRKRPIGLLFD